jgi:diaminohydroxyphosphoribosylaminopyrimidine deaminase / 5-amino-6-(5-phosphoribosylamino)uracil reductase
VLADDPLLTVRGIRGGRDPARVVLDGRLRTPPGARLLHSGSTAPTLVVTTSAAPARRVRALEAAGAEVVALPGKQGRVGLAALAKLLARRDLLRVLVEGGGEVHAAFMAAKLCDRLLLYLAPLAIGGAGAPAWLGGQGIARLARAPRFRFVGAPRALGGDLVVEAVPL